MPERYYTKTMTKHRADGTEYQYSYPQKYYTKTDHKQIDDEMKQKIMDDFKYGLPKTKISAKYGISTHRVTRVINGEK